MVAFDLTERFQRDLARCTWGRVRATGCTNLPWKIVHPDFVTGRESGAVPDRVLKLTDVTWPIVVTEGKLGLGREPQGASELLGEKASRQRKDILPPVTERRDLETEDLESVVEVFAKFARADELFQVAMGGAKHSDIDCKGTALPNASDLPVLQDS